MTESSTMMSLSYDVSYDKCEKCEHISGYTLLPALLHRSLDSYPSIRRLNIFLKFEGPTDKFLMSKDDAVAAASSLHALHVKSDINIHELECALNGSLEVLSRHIISEDLLLLEVEVKESVGASLMFAYEIDLLLLSAPFDLICLLECNRRVPSSLGMRCDQRIAGSSLRAIFFDLNYGVAFHDNQVIHLVNLVGSYECNLRYLDCGGMEMTKSQQEMLLGAIASNLHSRLTTLDLKWASAALKAQWLRLKSHHASTLKLFVCGDSRVGKTTLTSNICRRIPIPNLARFQNHPSTAGIQLHSLPIKHKELVICDIAGQHDYHTFHHFFMRGSEKDIFLIVCKVTKAYHNDKKLQDSLLYWLRFIASYRSSSARPKVLIALNYFATDIDIDFHALEAITQRFHEALEFVSHGKGLFFKVVATSVISLGQLKEVLAYSLTSTLLYSPPIPSLCNKVLKKDWAYIKKQKRKVVDLITLAQGLEDVTIEELKLTLSCLHDMGKVVYFGLDLKEDDFLSRHAILDAQWFMQEVVEVFMSLKGHSTENEGKLAIGMVIEKFRKIISEDEIIFILKLLHHMGFLIPHNEEWDKNNTWSIDNLPSKIIVPALLDKPFQAWTKENFEGSPSEYRCWARRFGCKEQNKDYILLPSGVFASIQCKARRLCNNSTFNLGGGWVSFREDGIGVVIQVGGDTNSWLDRQWLDIIIIVPQIDQPRYLKAEKIMADIKNIISDICSEFEPLRTLQEKVIDPTCATNYVLGKLDIQKDPLEVEFLDKILEKADAEGLDFIHDWKKHPCRLGELLMPEELKVYIKKWESLCHDYEESVAKIYGTPTINESVISEIQNPDIKLQTQIICVMLGEIASDVKDVKQLLKEMNNTWKKMARDMRTILVNTSQALQYLNVPNPRYPYLTDEENIMRRYYSLIGRTVRLHYMCEFPEGCHVIEDAKGVEIILEHSWYTRYSHVLGPAFTILFFVANLGVGCIPVVGSAGSTAVDFFASNLKESWTACFHTEANKVIPVDEHVKEVFGFVKQKANVKNYDVHQFVEEHFGLYSQGNIWVCERHRFN